MTDPRMTPTNDAPVTVEQCNRDRIKAVSVRLVDRMRDVARQDGWALAVHGSMSRDLDLVAVPWTDDASDEPSFVEAMRAAVACVLGGVAIVGAGEDGRTPAVKIKPNGRRCYTLHSTSAQLVESEAGAHPYIDLSVMDFRLAALASAPAVPREAVEAQLAAVEAKAADTLWTGSPLLKGLAVYVRAIIASAPAECPLCGTGPHDPDCPHHPVYDTLASASAGDGVREALQLARDLIDSIEQSSGNLWWVNVNDPETAVCHVSDVLDRAIAASLPLLTDQSGEDVLWHDAREIALKFALPGKYDGQPSHAVRKGKCDNQDYMGAIRYALSLAALARPRVAVGEQSREAIALVINGGFGDPKHDRPSAANKSWADALAKADAILALQSPPAKVEE